MAEGSLIVMEGTVLDMLDVYDDLDRHITEKEYDVRCFGYDPYNAREFVERWTTENGPFGVEKVIQGSKTESVPLGELKKLEVLDLYGNSISDISARCGFSSQSYFNYKFKLHILITSQHLEKQMVISQHFQALNHFNNISVLLINKH